MINDRYSIIDKIGEGRAKVFSCSDKFNSKKKFAIKILSYTANDDELQSFDEEYDLLRKFDHQNIITVFSKGTILTLEDFEKTEFHISENDKYFVMEYVDGVNIDQYSHLKLESVFLNVLEQLSSVFYYIHQANYIYSDIKAENILIIDENDRPTVKLIDFGLASYLPNLKDDFVKGTAEYIAPEILKNEQPNHRADLYSLGILLYKLIYGKYPYSTTDELEIYHAHLQKKFEFPACRYSRSIISILKKLLAKSPEDRCQSAIEIFKEFGSEVTDRVKLNFKPVFQFIPRQKLLKDIENFQAPENESNILILSGEHGSGKSEILQYLNKAYSNSLLIDISSFTKSANFWQQFFNKLIYSDFLYKEIDESLEHYISIHLSDNSKNLRAELKSIMAKISKKSDFILLIDDIENTNPSIIETFSELLPILQANNIKMIFSKRNDSNELFDSLENKSEILIPPLVDDEITKLVEMSFQNEYPKENLTKLLLSYSSRNPNGIANFIFDMILAGIIEFTFGKTIVNDDSELLKKYVDSQALIYDKIYNDLLLTELTVLEIISLFKTERSIEIISEIVKIPNNEVLDIIATLQRKNIIKSTARNVNPIFTNEGLKNYIYQNIKDSKALHLKAANVLKHFSAEVNPFIIVDQFELSDRYDLAIEIIDNVINNIKSASHTQFNRRLLERKLGYKLANEDRAETLLKLIQILVESGEYVLAQTELKRLESKDLKLRSAILKKKFLGITLVNLGELSKGLKVLKSIFDKIENERNQILFEMANAHLELSEFSETEEICKQIIKSEKSDFEILGRVYNLLGLSALYNGAELNDVMEHFNSASKQYKKINNLMRVAAIELNMGNIFYLMGNYSKAEKHWSKALQLNQSIGNVSQEAQILLNYGVFNYERAKYEEAVELYRQAEVIFKGLGSKKDKGLVLTNLGETYLAICEYQLCYDSLLESKKIFKEIKNEIELSEALLLLGKFFWIIGNKAELIYIMKELNKLNIEKNESILMRLSFMKRISKLMNNFEVKDVPKFFEMIEESKSINQKRMGLDIQFIIIDLLLKNEFTEGIPELLDDKDLLNFCINNPHFNAKRQLILFKLSQLKSNNKYEKPIVHLKKGIESLELLSITEDTITILNHLMIYYHERGNISKAKEYGDLYFAILEYVIDNIKTRKIKNNYLKTSRIKNYLESYKNLQN